MPSDQPVPMGLTESTDDSRASFERFSRRLIGLARCHLEVRLQNKVDPEDVVQSAYKSFFLRYGDGDLASEGWEGLWGLLSLITIRKCADRARYFHTEGRDVSREVGHRPDAGSGAAWLAAPAREPTPDEAIALAETVEELLRSLSGDERTIVELSLQGYSTQEISDLTGRAERSVRRLREQVRKQLHQQQMETAL